jgi:hypothetical protein
VFAQLGGREEHDHRSWICDTGAMNHMSGSRSAFAKLDTAVQGTVRFGNDSVTEIEGRGTVEFLCKDGEHRAFAGVYYIPRLTANIVSLGQLDELDYDIHIGCLLARVERRPNRLYVLDVNVARREVCLSAREEAMVKRWHARLGHVNMQVLRRMANQEVVRGLPLIGAVEQKRSHFPNRAA